MIWMLVIADDFTGALDTGVQFAKQGISTRVGTMLEKKQMKLDTEVLVLDLETRHLEPQKAYERVRKASLWAREEQIPIIYKKTDSVLRGNIGSELTAVIDTADEKTLYFIPAFPKMNRYTVNGIQYLNDVPLAETELGKDAFEPVTCSYIPDIIKKQSSCSTKVIKADEKVAEKEVKGQEKTICICDASTEQDIKRRVTELDELGQLKILAGCAGCAEYLAEILKRETGRAPARQKAAGILISCGSLNQITKRQLDYLEEKGKKRIHLTDVQKTRPDYYEMQEGKEFLTSLKEIICREGIVAVDTLNQDGNGILVPGARFDIARCHGIIAKKLIEEKCINTVVMMGGDTLMGFMEETACSSIHPVCELREGAVLSEIMYAGQKIQVVSKSGGFGEKELLYEIVEELKEKKEGEKL